MVPCTPLGCGKLAPRPSFTLARALGEVAEWLKALAC